MPTEPNHHRSPRDCPSNEPLPRPKRLRPRSNNITQDFVHGVYKWDFTNLLPPRPYPTGKETLEFRQPPGSRTPEEALAYVELAVAFVAGAVHRPLDSTAAAEFDPGSDKRCANALREELWWLLCGGAQNSGIGDLGGVEKLFVQVQVRKPESETGKKGRK
jgi:hypothetical protein